MSSYSINITGFKELQNLFNTLSKGQQKVLTQELREAASEITAAMRRDVPVDQARLKNSISYKVAGDLKVEINAGSGYAPYVEFGTKRNAKVPAGLQDVASSFRGPTGISETDPLVALTAWVRRKGIVATYDIRTKKRKSRNKAEAKRERNIAYLIFRKIKKEGVKAQPFFYSDKSGKLRLESIQKTITENLIRGVNLLLR